MKNILLSVSIIISLISSTPIIAEEKGFFSTMYDDLTSSGAGNILERNKIRKWYKNNKGKLVIIGGSESLSCVKKEFSDRDYDCTFSAELVNHTNDELGALVLNVKAYNKLKNALVTEEIVTLKISLYPTVKKTIKAKFLSENIGHAQSQLGSNFSWNYEMIAYLPEHLKIENPNWYEINDFRFRNNTYDWLAE